MTSQARQYLRTILLLIICAVLSFTGCQTTEQARDNLASQISSDREEISTPPEPETDVSEKPAAPGDAIDDGTDDATKTEEGRTADAAERTGEPPSETLAEDATAEPLDEGVSPAVERDVATVDQPEVHRTETPAWSAPTITAQSPPDRSKVRMMSQWIENRPMAVYFDGDGEDRELRRQMIAQRLAEGGIQYLPVDSPTIAENTLVVTIADRQQDTSGSRNYYGTTQILLHIVFSGEDEVVPPAIVTGPNVFSSVSHRDAALNSLYRVNPRSLRRAVFELRREVSWRLAQRGLSYRFSVDPRGDESAQRAVLTSIGFPGETDNIWYIPHTPEETEQKILDAIIGSRYRLEMDRSTRSGRLVVHEERK